LREVTAVFLRGLVEAVDDVQAALKRLANPCVEPLIETTSTENAEILKSSTVGITAKSRKQKTRRVFNREPSFPRRSSRMSLTAFRNTRNKSTMINRMLMFMSPKKNMLFTKGSCELTRSRCTSTAASKIKAVSTTPTVTRSRRRLFCS
jgi:hypothetical protein